jgi:hypothetical protein
MASCKGIVVPIHCRLTGTDPRRLHLRVGVEDRVLQDRGICRPCSHEHFSDEVVDWNVNRQRKQSRLEKGLTVQTPWIRTRQATVDRLPEVRRLIFGHAPPDLVYVPVFLKLPLRSGAIDVKRSE